MMSKQEFENYDYSKLTLELLNTYDKYDRAKLLGYYHQWLKVMRGYQKNIIF